jgi:hypothetical protein
VISDLSGLTGQTIMRAILARERDPPNSAELSEPGLHASEAEIAKAWKPEIRLVVISGKPDSRVRSDT